MYDTMMMQLTSSVWGWLLQTDERLKHGETLNIDKHALGLEWVCVSGRVRNGLVDAIVGAVVVVRKERDDCVTPLTLFVLPRVPFCERASVCKFVR